MRFCQTIVSTALPLCRLAVYIARRILIHLHPRPGVHASIHCVSTHPLVRRRDNGFLGCRHIYLSPLMSRLSVLNDGWTVLPSPHLSRAIICFLLICCVLRFLFVWFLFCLLVFVCLFVVVVLVVCVLFCLFAAFAHW